MIYSASIMVSSLRYAEDKNINIVKPYLSYYAVLTCCRALLFVLPNQQWKESGFIDARHTKIANIVRDTCSKLGQEFGELIYHDIVQLKDNRELFSYRFPASGIIEEYSKINSDYIKNICGLLCEISQLTSEQIENYYIKNFTDCKPEVDMNYEYIKKAFLYTTNDISIIDDEDLSRIDYISRKQPFPTSIWMTMSEGMTEDFFGAWCPEDDSTDLYNPDVDWQIIFQVP